MDWDIESLTRKYEKIFRGEKNATAAPLNFYEEPFFERARGFRNAAELLLDEISKNYNGRSAESIPAALYLCRQAIELHLKSMRTMMAKENPSEYPAGKGHDLLELWKPIAAFMKSVGFIFEDGSLHYRVERLLSEFTDEDGFGDRFRYPDSAHPAASDGLWIDFETLKKSMWDIDLLNFGFHEIISEFNANQ